VVAGAGVQYSVTWIFDASQAGGAFDADHRPMTTAQAPNTSAITTSTLCIGAIIAEGRAFGFFARRVFGLRTNVQQDTRDMRENSAP